MSTAAALVALPLATDGEIAAINLESARRRAWVRFASGTRTPDVVEALVDLECLKAQFLGDLDALDRLESLASHFAGDEESCRAALVQAQVASMLHRFADAREHLARAAQMGARGDAIERQTLTVNQACGADLDGVLDARCRIATESGRLEDLVPLGAVFADRERFVEADVVYQQAFYGYDGTSPFPLAWVCSQLGVLWAELVPEPNLDLATLWYRRAIAYLPGYVRARVHLAEVHLSQDQVDEAEAVLMPALASTDPEARWRLADVLLTQGRFAEAEKLLDTARSNFEELLTKHLLAFADHGAEFYAGSGSDPERALELARINVSNRPTRRASKQMNAIAERIDQDALVGARESATRATHLSARPNPM